MVEHLVSCVVVDNLSGAYTCFRLLFYTDFHTRHFCQNANFAHCVARMKILCAVFYSEILCSHICENPRIRLDPFLGVNNHIIHLYSYISNLMCLETLMKPKALSFKIFLALFFYLYPFIFISQINLASFTGSSATGKISRLVH